MLEFLCITVTVFVHMHIMVGYQVICGFVSNKYRGNYQRLEFLGDGILQFLVSKHVYMRFPSHNEGHLSVRSVTCKYFTSSLLSVHVLKS